MLEVGEAPALSWRASRATPLPARASHRTRAGSQQDPTGGFELAGLGAFDGQSAAPRSRRGRWLRRVLAAVFAALTGVFALNVMTDGGRRSHPVASLVPDPDAIARVAGLGIDQVSLTGHRFTADGELFDALDLANVRSMASLDAGAVRRRLERLPWIKTAELRRVFPDRLDVRITERKPSALWARGGRNYLIDDTGRVLSPVGASAGLDLPRVSGEGAASEAAALLALLERYPDLARRLEEAERVAERRWTLKLKGGVILHLPADREASALAAMASGGELAALLSVANRIIDLRAPGRVSVRTAPEAPSSAATVKSGT